VPATTASRFHSSTPAYAGRRAHPARLAGDAALPQVGETVSVELDWAASAHMRMHTCLHPPRRRPALRRDGGSSDERSRLDFDMQDGVDREHVDARLNELVTGDYAVRTFWITHRSSIGDRI
jgi:misacylated tRNA(Ala) deacylase